MRILGGAPRYEKLNEPQRGSGCLVRLFQALLLGIVLIAGAVFWVSRDDPTFVARKSRELVLRALGIEDTPLVMVEPLMYVGDNLWVPASADGARPRVIDRVKIAALFRRRKFQELERFYSELLADFEKDRALDLPLFNVFDALTASDPEALALAEQWLRESPDGLMPRFLRAQQQFQIGFRVRSEQSAANAGPLRMWLMTVPMQRARKEAEALLDRHPTFLPALVLAMRVSQVISDESRWETFRARAYELSPRSVTLHKYALEGLQPRWGGSYEKMESYISMLQPDAVTHPQLRPFAGYADAERAVWFTYEGNVDYPKALALYDKALSHGESWELLLQRGEALRRSKDYEAARRDLDCALHLNPFNLSVLSERLYLLIAQKEHLEAARTGLTLARLDPYAHAVTSKFKWLVEAARHVGATAYHAGRFRDSAEAYQVASELAPYDRLNDQGLSAAWHALVKGDEATIKAIERVLAIDPDDFDAHIQLEIALHHARRLREMIPRWDRFIARHRDDLRAYDERGGCYSAIRQKDKAGEDWLYACEGGLLHACAQLAELGLSEPPRPGQGAAGISLGF